MPKPEEIGGQWALWIPSHIDLAHHPKTRKLSRRLARDIPATVGHLHVLWHWALKYAPTGDLSQHGADDIAIGAMYDQNPDDFLGSLIACGFVDKHEDGSISLHDWDHYGGRLLEQRRVLSKAGKKGAAKRWGGHSQANANGMASDSREENSTGENTTADDSTGEREDSGALALEITKDWLPSPEAQAEARTRFPHENLQDHRDAFVYYYLAEGKTCKDWDSKWLLWIDREERGSFDR